MAPSAACPRAAWAGSRGRPQAGCQRCRVPSPFRTSGTRPGLVAPPPLSTHPERSCLCPLPGLCPSPCRTPALWPAPPLLFGHQPTGSGDSRAVAPQELRGLGARLAPQMGPQRVLARQALPPRELPSTLGASPRPQPGAPGAHGHSPVLSPHPRLLPLGLLLVPDPPPGVLGSSLSWGVLHAFHTRLKCGYCPTTRAEPAGSSQGWRPPGSLTTRGSCRAAQSRARWRWSHRPHR